MLAASKSANYHNPCIKFARPPSYSAFLPATPSLLQPVLSHSHATTMTAQHTCWSWLPKHKHATGNRHEHVLCLSFQPAMCRQQSPPMAQKAQWSCCNASKHCMQALHASKSTKQGVGTALQASPNTCEEAKPHTHEAGFLWLETQCRNHH